MDVTAPESIEDRLNDAVAAANAAHIQLVDVVIELQQNDQAWYGPGIRSLRHYLTWKTGMSTATANRLMAVAAARDTHPAVVASFRAGTLTLDQAAAAVKAPAHNDTEIAGLAQLSTVDQVNEEARVANQPMPPPVHAEDRESCTSYFDDDGRLHLSAVLDADRGRIVQAALSAAKDRLFRDDCDRRPTWADALVDVAERSLSSEARPDAERFRVNLYLDPTADLPATWADGSTVPDTLRQLLDCDGTLTPTFVEAGLPVSVGRALRIVPDRTRRLIQRRDRNRCRSPWCSSRRGLVAHHIHHWEHGGPTDTPNLLSLCGSCHRRLHHGEFTITGEADRPETIRFLDPHGTPIVRPAPPPLPSQPPDPVGPYTPPLGDRLHPDALSFTPPPDRHGGNHAGLDGDVDADLQHALTHWHTWASTDADSQVA